jgi:hypothetical protein
VKEFLSREGHRFSERNVEEDDRAFDELVSRGLRVVPVTVIGNRLIKGFDVGALRSALADQPDQSDQ